MATRDKLLIFAGSASPAFTAAIARHLDVTPGECLAKQFSDGNTFVRVLGNVRGKDVFMVQSFSQPVNDSLVELLFYIDAFKRASAASVTAVIPYFSYGKGDKKDQPRVSLRARVVADCLEAVGVDRIVTMDLHAPQIQGFFRVPVDHLYALPVIADHFKDRVTEDWAIVAPDLGAVQMANAYARVLGARTVIAEKTRPNQDENAVVHEIIGDVRDRNCLIVDDFTISGGTLIATAQRLRDEGAAEVYAAVSHGVLSPGSGAKLMASPIKELVITDTLERRAEALPALVTVVSAAPLFAQAILSIHEQTSVSALFEY